MKRRELIKIVTLASGAALSAPLLGSLLTSCESSKVVDGYSPQFFNESEFNFIKSLVDVIIPATDSPSATDVGVHQTIDVMVGTVYKEGHQKEYKNRLTRLIEYIGNSTDDELQSIKSLSKSTEENDKKAKRGLLEIKQQTIAYYLTTEEVAKNHLNYLPIPGKYEPCISLDEVGGKAWAL